MIFFGFTKLAKPWSKHLCVRKLATARSRAFSCVFDGIID